MIFHSLTLVASKTGPLDLNAFRTERLAFVFDLVSQVVYIQTTMSTCMDPYIMVTGLTGVFRKKYCITPSSVGKHRVLFPFKKGTIGWFLLQTPVSFHIVLDTYMFPMFP